MFKPHLELCVTIHKSFAKEFEVQSRKKGVVLAVHLQLRLTLCTSIGANLPIDMEVEIFVFKLNRPFL